LTTSDGAWPSAGAGDSCPIATDVNRHIAIINFIELSQYNEMEQYKTMKAGSADIQS
jgi:hypothetical protein